MYKLKFIVKYTASNQHGQFAVLHPVQQIHNYIRNILGHRPEVNNLSRQIDHAHWPGTKHTGFLFQPPHHHAMSRQKVIYGVGVQILQALINLKSVVDLRNVLGRCQHLLAILDCGDLVQCHRVLLNSQGASDPVASTQGRVGRETVCGGHPAHQLHALCYIGYNSISQFKWRVFPCILPRSAMVIVSGPFFHIPGTIDKLLNP